MYESGHWHEGWDKVFSVAESQRVNQIRLHLAASLRLDWRFLKCDQESMPWPQALDRYRESRAQTIDGG